MPEIIVGHKQISQRVTQIILEYCEAHNGHTIKMRHLRIKNSCFKRYTCSDCTKGPDLIFLLQKHKVRSYLDEANDR